MIRLCLSLMLFGTSAQAAPLSEIRVEGNRRVEDAAVLGTISTRVGQEIDPIRVARDIRRLWDLGRFSSIDWLLESGTVLIIRVKERPSVREVRHEGLDDIDQEERDGVTEVKAGFPIDEAAVRRSTVKLRKLLSDKGYYLSEVGYRILEAPDQRVDVVFDYVQGNKVLIHRYALVGNREIDDGELKGRLQLKERDWMHFLTDSGVFDEEKLNIDSQILEMLYRDRGYLDVKIGTPRVEVTPDKAGLTIEIPIEEGKAYTVGRLGFAGELILPADRLDRVTELKPGALFSAGALHRSTAALTRIYKDKGYAYANIGTDARPRKQEQIVDLDFTLQRGPRVRVERIEISGNYKTRDKVIRRQMKLQEGDLYSATAVERSKLRITTLGFFEQEGGVEIIERPGSAPDQIVLEVKVREQMTGSINANFGYSSYDNFLAMAAVSQDNFLGHGTKLALQAQYSSVRQIFSFNYSDPHLLDTNWTLSFSLFDNETAYDNFVRDARGATLVGGYRFGDYLHLSLGWMGEHVAIDQENLRIPLPGVIPGEGLFTSALKIRSTWDSRDNRLYPSRGWYNTLGFDWAEPWMLSEVSLLRTDAAVRGYYPLPLGAVFKASVRLGHLYSDRPLPQENFFAGGIYSLRGFRLRSVGPTARVPNGYTPDSPMVEEVVGGNKQLIGSFEVEFPLVRAARLTGVVFYDAGNVWARGEPWLGGQPGVWPHGLLHSVGYGVRWQSPMGPLRFEIGYPLTPRSGPIYDEPSLFEFTIGSLF
ncbi:MAG: outer membrane protein assembly factor BamA [Myxococcales bacterium]|nr:outer membrane protein assembly factor BamA [Myxococcales bacterium]